jgi:Flp pilus assembly protein TadD
MAVIVVLAALAWWAVSRDRRTSPTATSDPGALLGGPQAHERGLALAREGDPLAAAPYFRRVVVLHPDSWFAHENLASALGNGAQQARFHLGKAETATRSSVERVAMMREALRETEAAELLSGAPADRAVALFERGRALQTWGFPSDAAVLFQKAATAAPTRTDILASLRSAERSLAGGGRSVE